MILIENASEKANKYNLKYIGFGRYVSPAGKLYVSDGDKIKPYVRKQDRMSFANNVKSILNVKEFNEISELIKKGKIVYSEREKESGEVDKYFGKLGLTAPDFIHGLIPKQIYLSPHSLQVNINFLKNKLLFTAFSENSGFYCEYAIRKESKHYVASMVNFRCSENVFGSENIRKYMYRLVNFFNVMGVYVLFVNCGYTYGTYMWSRYGVTFIDSKERIEYLKKIKKHINDEIINRANENDEFNKVIKDGYSLIVNAKHSWDISHITFQLSNDALMYIKERLKDVEHFIDGNYLFFGKMVMIKTEFKGFMPMFPDSPSYIQYYKYMTFKTPKSNLKETKLVLESKVKSEENLITSPYEIITPDKKKTDVKVWKQDKYDKLYEKETMEIVNGR